MKKFKFRLEKVLDYKTRLFDIAKEEFLQEKKILDELKLKLEEIKKEYQDCLLQLINRTKESFSTKEISVYYKYIFFKKFEIRQQIELIAEQTQKVNEKREKLVEVSKEKEVLTKLKERKFQQYQYALSVEEQKFLNDISNASYIRTNAEG